MFGYKLSGRQQYDTTYKNEEREREKKVKWVLISVA